MCYFMFVYTETLVLVSSMMSSYTGVVMEQASPPTTVRVCSRKLTIKLNSLESIWYCVFVVVVTLFLCLDATRHYAHYDKLEWPQGEEGGGC